MIKGIFYACGSLGPVRHRNHNRRGLESSIFPGFGCFQPVLPQKIIPIGYQIGHGFVRFCFPVNIVFDFRVIVNMVKTGLILLGQFTIITDDYSRGLYET